MHAPNNGNSTCPVQITAQQNEFKRETGVLAKKCDREIISFCMYPRCAQTNYAIIFFRMNDPIITYTCAKPSCMEQVANALYYFITGTNPVVMSTRMM